MKEKKENLFKYDKYRYIKNIKYWYQHHEIRYLKAFRKIKSVGMLTSFYKLKMLHLKKKYHIQIPKEVKIDNGFSYKTLGKNNY